MEGKKEKEKKRKGKKKRKEEWKKIEKIKEILGKPFKKFQKILEINFKLESMPKPENYPVTHFEVIACIPRKLERLSQGEKIFLENSKNSEMLFYELLQ